MKIVKLTKKEPIKSFIPNKVQRPVLISIDIVIIPISLKNFFI